MTIDKETREYVHELEVYKIGQGRQNDELRRIQGELELHQMELESQQIELELQNEELSKARIALELSRDKYTQLAAETQVAREYAENIVETVREPLVVLTADLKILSANHSFYETFKVTPEVTIGNFIYDLGNRQWYIPALRVLFEEILPNETVLKDYEVEHDFLGIGRKTMLLNARQIFSKDIGSHIILLAIEDITERKHTEALLQKQQCELQALNADLEERVKDEVIKGIAKDLLVMRQDKLASLGTLAAGVAHEINNPISYIASNIKMLTDYMHHVGMYVALQQELLAKTATTEQQEELAAAAQNLEIFMILEDGPAIITESLEGVERVARIVRYLKCFSRVDAPEYEATDLTTCLEDAFKMVRDELKDVADIDKQYQELPQILCHPGQLNQVFLNLLSNAGQAVTPPGRITLKSRYDAGFVYVSVEDNGHGIPEKLRERIFEPFFTTKDVGKGTGLGLSISHDIITRHGGELLVESSVGVGTIFTVKLPRTERGSRD